MEGPGIVADALPVEILPIFHPGGSGKRDSDKVELKIRPKINTSHSAPPWLEVLCSHHGDTEHQPLSNQVPGNYRLCSGDA